MNASSGTQHTNSAIASIRNHNELSDQEALIKTVKLSSQGAFSQKKNIYISFDIAINNFNKRKRKDNFKNAS